MSILVNKDTKVICQGLPVLRYFPFEQAIAYGTKLVGGVTPARAVRPIWVCRFSTRSRRPLKRRKPMPP